MTVELVVGKSLTLEVEFVETDITGWTVTMEGKRQEGDSTLLFTKVAVITDATGGKCELRFTGSDTNGLQVGEFIYDLYYNDGTNTVSVANNQQLIIEK
jgi:hypothetical protein